MNKTYRLVWCSFRNAWIAVSELSKSKTKSSKTRTIGSVIAAGLMVTFSAGAFASPNDPLDCQPNQAPNTVNHTNAFYGNNIVCQWNTMDSSFFGNDITAADNAFNMTSVGNSINTQGESNTAVGSKIDSQGRWNTAVGNNLNIVSEHTNAFGNNISATGLDSTFIGSDITAVNTNNTNILGNHITIKNTTANSEATRDPVTDEIIVPAVMGGTILGNNIGVTDSRGVTVTGDSNTVTASNGISIFGPKNIANLAPNSTIIGRNNQIQDAYESTVVGLNSKITGRYHSVALGNQVTIDQAVAGIGIGSNASVASNFGTAIGNSALVDNSSYAGTAIGNFAKVQQSGFGTALGNAATVSNSYASQALGSKTSVTDSKSAAAIGDTAKVASSNFALASGASAKVEDSYGGTALGLSTSVSSSTASSAIGAGSSVTGGNDSSAIGRSASVSDSKFSTAVGTSASVKSSYFALASGASANVTDSYAGTALGHSASVTNSVRASASGNNASVTDSSYAQADGAGAKVTSSKSATAVGNDAKVTSSVNAGAYGQNASVTNSANSTALGQNAIVNNSNSAMALGQKSLVDGSINASAVGYGSQVINNSIYSQAFGASNIIDGSTNATGVGVNTKISASNNAVAMGNGANVASAKDGIAIGTNANVTVANSVALGAGSTAVAAAVPTNTATVGPYTYTGFAGTSPVGVVSVGSAGKERQITNVAAGRISTTSTDAINGSQLYATQQTIGNLANSTANIIGTPVTVNPDGTLTSGNIGGTTKNNVSDAINEVRTTPLNFAGNKGDTISKKLGDTLNIVGGLAPTAAATAANTRVDSEDGNLVVKMAKDLTDLNSITLGNTVLNQSGLTIGNPYGSTGPSITTAGINAGGKTITNVAAGQAPTDAVNVSQLEKAQAAATTKVEEADGIKVVPTKNADGSTTYTVSAKTDGTTTTINADGKIAAVTTTFKPSDDGKVGAPVGNGDSLVTANTVADAINKSGWKLAADGTTGTELIKPSDTVTFKTGSSNLTVKRDGANITYDLAKDININSVQFNDGPKITNDGDNIKVGDKDGNATKITNVKAGEANTDAVNVSQLKEAANNLVTTGFNIADGKGGKDNVKLGETVTFTDPAGNIITTVTDNKVEFGLNSTLSVGKDGEPGKVGIKGADGKDAISLNGKDGTIGLKGADGKDGISLNGKDGTIGINGKDGANATLTVEKAKPALDGKDGQNGEDGQTRIVYTKPNGSKEEVATLNDGLNFKADDGSIVAKKLNETLEIVGGADKDKLTDNNIGVNNKDGKLTVQLAKDLKGIDSITVNNGPVISGNGIDMNGDKITNVKAGTEDNDAVNVSQLKAVEATANKGWNLTTNGKAESKSNVKPGDTVDFNNTDGNVKIKNTGNNVTVDLNKDIKLAKDGSVTIGDTKVNNDGLTIAGGPSVTKSGINAGDKKITNVAPGEISADSKDAVNGGQLYATEQKGLNFAGNTGDDIHKALGETLTIKGGLADTAAATDANTRVDEVDGQLVVNMAKDLTDLTSVTTTDASGNTSVLNGAGLTSTDFAGNKTVVNGAGVATKDAAGNSTVMNGNGLVSTDFTGNKTVINGSGLTVVNKDGSTGPSITNTGIDAGGLKVTNVADGEISATSKDAVNGSQLHQTTVDLTNQGLNFADSNGNVTHKNLGDTLGIIGGGTKADSDYSASNVKTTTDENGNIVVMLDKDLNADSLTINGKDGVDGAPGTPGFTITGATGPAGVNGAPGETTTRIVYDDGTGPQEVATLNDGLKFAGNQGDVIAKKLNETLTVKGGLDNDADASDANLRVDSEDGNLVVKMAKDLTDLNSITLGNTILNQGGLTITNPDGSKGPSITTDGISAGGKVITDVAPGVNGTDAVNVDQLGAKSDELTNKGLNFKDSNGNVTHKNLGETLGIFGGGTKADSEYSSSNIKTTTDADGNVVVMLDKNLNADSLTINGKDGVDGAPGTPGFTLAGATGPAGVNGAPGETTTRIVYNDGTGPQEVATLNDGLKFAGNQGDVIAKKLNETLTVKGGLVNDADASDANLRVDSEDGNLVVKMAKDLTDLNSVTLGNTVLNQDGLTVGGANGPSITTAGINAGGLTITNVAAGQAPTDAVNVSQLKDAAAAATTEVKAADGDKNVSVTSATADDGHTIYSVGVSRDLDVDSVTLAHADGSSTLLNADGLSFKDAMGTATGPSITAGGIDAGNLKVTNVADGEISATSKDAVNGSQLYNLGNNVTNIFGGNATYNGDQIVWNNIGGTGQNTIDDAIKYVNDQASNANQGWNVATDSGTASTVKPGDTVNINGDKNSGVTVTNDGNNITVGLSDKVNVGDKVSIDGNTGTINAGKVTIDGENGTIGGLTNTTWDPNNITSGQAATEDQLAQVAQNASNQAAASKEEVKSADGSVTVTKTQNAKGANVYDLSVNTDGTTIKKNADGSLAVNTTSLTNTDGKVNTPAAPKALATAGDIANAINDSGFTLTAQGSNGSLVKPGATVDMNNTDGNIVISKSASDNNVTYNLAKDLKVGSVTAGDTVVNNDGITINNGSANGNTVSLTKDGLNNGGNRITNVAPGVNGTDAVNVDQLKGVGQHINNRIDDVADDANAGVSSAMAMAALPQAYIPGKSMLTGGIASYNGEGAVAVGFSKLSDNGRWVLKVSGSADTQGNAGGAVGAGFHF